MCFAKKITKALNPHLKVVEHYPHYSTTHSQNPEGINPIIGSLCTLDSPFLLGWEPPLDPPPTRTALTVTVLTTKSAMVVTVVDDHISAQKKSELPQSSNPVFKRTVFYTTGPIFTRVN